MKFDRRALGKRVSAIAAADAAGILACGDGAARLHARVVGITGAPGAGKSTLIGRLAPVRLGPATTLAVLAIDPTSPATEGSLLGDRIRMEPIVADPRIYIRSLPSRSAIDGLTHNVVDLLSTLDAAGFDEVMIETVGVGQTGNGLRAVADVAILVLTPGSGDYVQAMKAGIMEIADVYVINKAELTGADRLRLEVETVLQRKREGPLPPVIPIREGGTEGIVALSEAIDRCLAAMANPAARALRERARRRYRIENLVARRIRETIDALPEALWDGPASTAYAQILDALVPSPGR